MNNHAKTTRIHKLSHVKHRKSTAPAEAKLIRLSEDELEVLEVALLTLRQRLAAAQSDETGEAIAAIERLAKRLGLEVTLPSGEDSGKAA